MNNQHFEEETFTNNINTHTILRIFKTASKYWYLIVMYMIFIIYTSFTESASTYILKLFTDEGIIKHNSEMAIKYMTIYGILIASIALSVFGFIYFAGKLGERL